MVGFAHETTIEVLLIFVASADRTGQIVADTEASAMENDMILSVLAPPESVSR